jgi:hypothetical protein
VLVLAGGLDDQEASDGAKQSEEEEKEVHDPPLVRRSARSFRSIAPRKALA